MAAHSLVAALVPLIAIASGVFAQTDPESAPRNTTPAPQYNEVDRLDLATETTTPFRTDTITIRVGGLAENFGAIEYKVTMQEGDALIYTWEAPIELYHEVHGHPPLDPSAELLDIFYYGRAEASSMSGSFQAAVDGIHGWYFANPGLDAIEIEMTLAGFYELQPGIINRSSLPAN